MDHHCSFCGLFGRPKNNKAGKRSTRKADNKKGVRNLQVKLEGQEKSHQIDEVLSTSFHFPAPFPVTGSSRYTVKVMNHESPVGRDIEEVAYEGEDENGERSSIKRENSGSDLEALESYSNEGNDQPFGRKIYLSQTVDSDLKDQYEKSLAKDAEDLEMVRSENLSDPGIGGAEFWTSRTLTRSCSDLGRREMVRKVSDQFPLIKSQSFEELHKLVESVNQEVSREIPESPVSVVTHRSADRVILKKHSSSKILPSGSKKLWWKLFLWSHRNLHKAGTSKPPKTLMNLALNQQGGYSSDTLEPRRFSKSSKPETPNSFAAESSKYGHLDQGWDEIHGTSVLWPQNQWVALPADSRTMSRVDEWVKDLMVQHPFQDSKEDDAESSTVFSYSLEKGTSPARSSDQPTSHPFSTIPEEIAVMNSSYMANHPAINIPEEIAHANSVVQSLNASSTVAHMVGNGLKVVPQLSHLSGLRFVNLSSNYIVHIAPGSLPKGLHALDLSKNKISSIEGLRELTRLRVLDLSYNRISRIGQGLSNCILIKELYLAGNKISDVDGLHRLLKLAILDLSFNKITTTKSLGQLVANYNSLVALNLLGNPIQININDDQLRKRVCSLLPRLAFLNKQPINRQKVREIGTESIARHAVRNGGRSIRRKTTAKVNYSSPVYNVHRNSSKGRGKSKSGAHYPSSWKAKSSNIASSSR